MSNIYFLSKDVKVFPATFRGSASVIEGTSTQAEAGATAEGASPQATVVTAKFDPESALVTEYNYTNLPGLIVGPGDPSSYIISAVIDKDESSKVAKVCCVIAGYYFEITEDLPKVPEEGTSSSTLVTAQKEGSSDSYSWKANLKFSIKVKAPPLVAEDNNGDRERLLHYLAGFETSATPLDQTIGGKFYFTGLLVGTNTGATTSLTITDDSGEINQSALLTEFATLFKGTDSDKTARRTSLDCTASGQYAFSEGGYAQVTDDDMEILESIGQDLTMLPKPGTDKTTASGQSSHAEGYATIASGNQSHAEGFDTKAQGFASHAEGFFTSVYRSGAFAHVEGYGAATSGIASHAEGYWTKAEGNASHAEGDNANASGIASHAEGGSITFNEWNTATREDSLDYYGTSAAGNSAHAEGFGTLANAPASHTEGIGTRVEDSASGAHAEGVRTTASVIGAHAEGYYCQTSTNQNDKGQHVQGRYSSMDDKKGYAHIVGGGTSLSDRKNIHTLDWEGNAWYAGDGEFGGVKLSTTYNRSGAVAAGRIEAKSTLFLTPAKNCSIYLQTKDTSEVEYNIILNPSSKAFYPGSTETLDLGTNLRKFKNGYFTGTVNADKFSGTATTAEKLVAVPGTSDKSRRVYFANSTTSDGEAKIAYNDNFTYNPSTGILKVPKIDGTATRAISDENGKNISKTYATKAAVANLIAQSGSGNIVIGINKHYGDKQLVVYTKAILPHMDVAQNCDLGTTTYKFKDGYFTGTVNAYKFKGSLEGTATKATKATTATTAETLEVVAGTDNKYRHVYFRYADKTLDNKAAKVVYDDDFTYNPSNNTLRVPKIDGTATRAISDENGKNISKTYATKAAVANLIGVSSTTNNIVIGIEGGYASEQLVVYTSAIVPHSSLTQSCDLGTTEHKFKDGYFTGTVNAGKFKGSLEGTATKATTATTATRATTATKADAIKIGNSYYTLKFVAGQLTFEQQS